MATEACGCGTSDLGYFPKVFVFIGEVGVDFTSGGSPGCPRGTGVGAPPPSWAARDSPGPTPILRGLLLVQK